MDMSCNENTAEVEPSPEEKSKKRLLSVIEYVEIFAAALFTVLLVFTFCFKICVVDGESMHNTLQHGERLLTSDTFYKPECGDIIVFYEDEPLNKPLIKRVIATEGQTVVINHNDGSVTVDGRLLTEDYVHLIGGSYINYPTYKRDENFETYTLTIPEGQVFVMGDNRNNSLDSRTSTVGCISENQIMGKVICRISPFTTFD